MRDVEAERAHALTEDRAERREEPEASVGPLEDEPGPSDERAEEGGVNDKESAGGVDAKATKVHLLGIARRLNVKGRSSMTKAELVDAIDTANVKATAKAREG